MELEYGPYASGGEEWTNELMAELDHTMTDASGPSLSELSESMPSPSIVSSSSPGTVTASTTANTTDGKKSRFKAKKRRRKPKNKATSTATEGISSTTTTTSTGAVPTSASNGAVDENKEKRRIQPTQKKKRKRGREEANAKNKKQLRECTLYIASKLEEKNRPAVQKSVEVLGAEVAKELLQETLKIQGQGGMFVENGTRKRTKGGVYFLLLKDRVTNENYQYIFSHNKERDKRRKKRQALRAKNAAEVKANSAATPPEKTQTSASDDSFESHPAFFKTHKTLNEILGMEEGEIASFKGASS
eukprot:gb/GECG01007907.1/.p1 GENE.gb/GECG01007907.1/~~gb/GECG01007907.1/.p1  ORF type:complete len:303 (+),score=62.78 gb/GECG01007907.1/:1-909(+)